MNDLLLNAFRSPSFTILLALLISNISIGYRQIKKIKTKQTTYLRIKSNHQVLLPRINALCHARQLYKDYLVVRICYEVVDVVVFFGLIQKATVLDIITGDLVVAHPETRDEGNTCALPPHMKRGLCS